MGFVRKVVDKIENIVEHIIEDPLPAIVNIGLMAVGVPPIFAAAASGAVGAAEHGGNILEGALLGGATGYVGGVAGSYAANAGAGTILQGAAQGAAQGATGGLLTGQNPLDAALSGGLIGGALGYFQNVDGSQTYTYDDGSTITRAADGTVSSTTSPDMPAPIVDRSTYVDTSGQGTPTGTGPVQPGDPTVTTNTDGSTVQHFDDGTSLTTHPDGTISSVDTSGGVKTTQFFDDGSTLSTHADGTVTHTDATDTVTTLAATDKVNPDGSITDKDGNTTYTYDDGSTLTVKADGTYTSTNSTDTGLIPGGKTPGWKDTVVTPMIPVSLTTDGVTNPSTRTPKTPGTPGDLGDLTEGPMTNLNTNMGLSPGLIAPTPFYQTTSPVQSQYYYGGHPFQAGETFDPGLYNTAPAAPEIPWGLQQMYQDLSPQDIAALTQSSEYQSMLPGGVTFNPMAPVAPGLG